MYAYDVHFMTCSYVRHLSINYYVTAAYNFNQNISDQCDSLQLQLFCSWLRKQICNRLYTA